MLQQAAEALESFSGVCVCVCVVCVCVYSCRYVCICKRVVSRYMYTLLLARTSPNLWLYTVYVRGSGQPYTCSMANPTHAAMKSLYDTRTGCKVANNPWQQLKLLPCMCTHIRMQHVAPCHINEVSICTGTGREIANNLWQQSRQLHTHVHSHTHAACRAMPR